MVVDSRAGVTKRVTILFLAANPSDTTRLAADEEMRQIDRKIRLAKHRDAVELVSHWAARPDDLQQALLDHQPHIVHFTGHGTTGEELVFVDPAGYAKSVTKEALSTVFRVLKDNVRLVSLNACFSLPQAQAINEHIDFVVGMRQSIEDQTGITFAESLYRAIAFGRSMAEAFELGIAGLQLDGNPQHDRPHLLIRPGANASSPLIAGPSSEPGKQAALAALLEQLFTSTSELRRWVYYKLGEGIYGSLPADPVSPQELVFQTILHAQRRQRINPALFRSLASDRQASTEQIRAVARAWLGHDAGIRAASPRLQQPLGHPASPGPQPAPAPPRQSPKPVASTSRPGNPPTLSRTRLTLDRIHQWAQLTTLCRDSNDHFAFLVHGDAGQDVHLFVERVQVYLSEQCRRVHRICRALFRDEYSTPHTPEEWDRRMRLATGYGHLPIEQALHRAAAIEPVLFILGNRTLSNLDTDETRALIEALDVHLPAWLEAARPKHPIRILIPIEHAEHADGLDDPLTRAVAGALEQAARAGLAFEHLIQLTFPLWFEVRDHIRKAIGHLDDDFLEQCKQAYDRVSSDPDVHKHSFARLADQLNQLLAERFEQYSP